MAHHKALQIMCSKLNDPKAIEEDMMLSKVKDL